MVLHCNEAASLVRLWTETVQLDHLCQSYISLSRRSSPDKGFLHLWTCRPLSLFLSLSCYFRTQFVSYARRSAQKAFHALKRSAIGHFSGASETSWKRVLRALNGRLFRGGSWQELIAARLPLMAIDGRLVIVRFVGTSSVRTNVSATFMTGHGGNKTLYRRITESRIDLERRYETRINGSSLWNGRVDTALTFVDNSRHRSIH